MDNKLRKEMPAEAQAKGKPSAKSKLGVAVEAERTSQVKTPDLCRGPARFAGRLPQLNLAFAGTVFVLVLAGWGLVACSAVDERIRKVENGLIEKYGQPPWKRMRLAERMEYHKVPGVSIAVINDFKIEWAKGYGIVEDGGNEAVTPDTLFQAASISKPVVAMAALRLVETGLLGLDEEVNDKLVSWKVPENEFTSREKVTLRRLLSHGAGVTVHGFKGYARGEEIPTLQQVLDGERPANSSPIRVDIVPGRQFRYSGGGFVIVQRLLMDVVGRPFPEIMQNVVLHSLRMTASTFEVPLPQEHEDRAATGHRGNGRPIPGKWHTYPEMGAASLWTTAPDLARFAVEIMRSRAGQSSKVLSQHMTSQMLTHQIRNYGLGIALGDDGGDRFHFLHSGANEGFRCILVAYPDRGQGVVIMTNGDNGEALWREILHSVSVKYGWVRDYTLLYASIALGMTILAAGLLLHRRMRRRKHRPKSPHVAGQ